LGITQGVSILPVAASTGTAKAVMYYLEDGAVEREGLMAIIMAIGDVVFRQFLLAMARLPNDPLKDAVLVDHCLYFLSHSCHRYFRVRTAAFRYAVDLLDRFPQLLWHDKWWVPVYESCYLPQITIDVVAVLNPC
jgi:hypothetical protein